MRLRYFDESARSNYPCDETTLEYASPTISNDCIIVTVPDTIRLRPWKSEIVDLGFSIEDIRSSSIDDYFISMNVLLPGVQMNVIGPLNSVDSPIRVHVQNQTDSTVTIPTGRVLGVIGRATPPKVDRRLSSPSRRSSYMRSNSVALQPYVLG